MRVVATSRARLPGFELEIGLGPLSREEMFAVWGSNQLNLSREEYERLYGAIGGYPLVGTLAGRLVRDNVTTIDDLNAYFKSFSTSGILGPDGRPLTRDSHEEQELISGVIRITDDLFDRISRNPSEMHALTPRQFEGECPRFRWR